MRKFREVTGTASPRKRFEVQLSGPDLLHEPFLNKGDAFTTQERATFGLTGLLPEAVTTLDEQVKRAYMQYQQQPDDPRKNISLNMLQDSNEVLFYKLLSEHMYEMLPVIYDPTVAVAIEKSSLEYRRPRGVYLSIDHPERIEESLRNYGAGPDDIDLLVATDAEEILGIGDWGVGGIQISVGKLAVYTAAAGIDPMRVIPVMLDVGTNRESLLNNPYYIGNRHARVRGERYDAFIDAYVTAASKLFPQALLHWEDFGPSNARRILDRYRDQVLTFNDDMQGTGAMNLAAVLSGVKASGTPLHDQRIVVFGAGTAGVGIADQLRDAMIAPGLTPDEASRRFCAVDRYGLPTDDLTDLRPLQ